MALSCAEGSHRDHLIYDLKFVFFLFGLCLGDLELAAVIADSGFQKATVIRRCTPASRKGVTAGKPCRLVGFGGISIALLCCVLDDIRNRVDTAGQANVTGSGLGLRVLGPRRGNPPQVMCTEKHAAMEGANP